MLSEVRPSFSETEKVRLKNAEERYNETVSHVSSQLYLKSSAAQASSKALDKEAVLRRIRHHKSLNKVRGAFQALVSSSGQANAAASEEQNWLDKDDAFSSP